MIAAMHQANEWYTQRFDLFERSLNGESKSELHAIRRKAIEKFAELGFPTTRDEEWRFTNLSPMAKIPFAPVTAPEVDKLADEDISKFLFRGLECHLLVFIDGHFDAKRSSVGPLPPGAKIGDLGQTLGRPPEEKPGGIGEFARFDSDALTALNTAFLQDGAYISVPDHTEMKLPVHLLFLSSRHSQPFLSVPRVFVHVGNDSQLAIIETYAGVDDNLYLTNAVTEMVVGQRAVVEHDKLQLESTNGYHIGTTHIHQMGASTYVANSVSFGASLVRNTVTARLEAGQCECTLNGLSLATGRQLVDNHTVIDHAKPNCVSHELYKAILDGRAKGVFNGKIFVRKDAQKTDAKQTNKTLLLSDEATIDTKPQLEIFADDVKCTHGATVGQLDEEQIFYLRSRGVGLEQARDLLTFAFASDVIRRIHVEPLREQLDHMLHARLREGRIAVTIDETSS
jgi:Fe-S cluster assembly protein SufD